MANNIQVKVTADVVQLQTQFAVARAETNALTSEVNKLARATAAGTIDPAGTARLKDLAAQLISSRSAMQGYAAQAAEAGVSLTSFGSAAAGAGHHSATAVRYVRELFDEISSGRTRYLPSTLASLGQTVLGMNLAMLAGVGAVGGLVAALAILAYRSVEAAAALDKAKIAADFSGNLSLSETAIRQFTAQLSSAANISKSEAQSITDALVRVPDMSTHTFSALASLVAAYAEASGEDVKKIGESLSKMFAPSESAEKLAASMAGITQREKDMAEAADRTGNVYQIQAAKLEILSDATNRAAADRAKLNSTLHTGSILQDIKNLGEYAKDVIIDNDADEARTVLLARNTAEVNRNADAVRSQIAALRQMPPPSQSVLQLGVEAATKENPLSLQILNTQTEIKKMTAALVVAKQQGDQINWGRSGASARGC